MSLFSSSLDVPDAARRWPSFARECRQTLALAAPLIAGQLGQMLMGVIDTVMVGRLGVVPLGASGFVNALLSVPFILGIGLLVSVSVKVSQARGARAHERARVVLKHGTALGLGFGLALLAGVWLGLPWLSLFRQPPEVTAASPGYVLLMAASMIPALLSLTWKSHADSLGHPWIPFGIIMGGVALNVLLNWVWIYGHWGFGAMGLEGAGLATLVARLLIAAGMFGWLTRSVEVRDWCPARFADWWTRWDGAVFFDLLKVGVPASLQLLTEIGAFSAVSLIAGTLGAVPLAAHQVAMTCASTTFMVPLGIGMAMTVRVGNVVGAREFPRLGRVLLSGWMFGIGSAFLSMLAFLGGGAWLASRFVADPVVIELAAALLVVAGFFQLVDAMQVISAGALRGINDVRVPATLTLFAYWGIAIPLGATLCLQAGWGARGLWVGLAAGLAVAAAALGVRAWKRLRREGMTR